MPGPKPTPSRLKIVKGERRPSRVNRAEPEPEGELGTPPKRLDKWARAEWKRLAPQVSWATESDQTAFALLCRALGDAERLRQDLAKEPATVQGSRGQVRHPKTYLLREAEDRSARLLAEFGLTPSSRTRVKVPPKRPAYDPAAEFFDR